jgi:hypothetical protein
MIFLSISGVLIWLLSNRRQRRSGIVVLVSSLAATFGIIAWALLA